MIQECARVEFLDDWLVGILTRGNHLTESTDQVTAVLYKRKKNAAD